MGLFPGIPQGSGRFISFSLYGKTPEAVSLLPAGRGGLIRWTPFEFDYKGAESLLPLFACQPLTPGH